MFGFLRGILPKSSRLYPGITSAQVVNGIKVRNIDIDDPLFNRRVTELLRRAELDAMDQSTYTKFLVSLTPEEEELYSKDSSKFEVIMQLQIMHNGLSLVIVPTGVAPGPPVEFTFFKGV